MHRIFDVIETYHMIEPGMQVIAGVSGGADSVCLLYVLSRYQKEVPFTLAAVHVEHGLRGEESLEDADFTKELCEKLGVPFYMVRAQVREKAEKEGLSLEEAGRLERYRIFEEMRGKLGAQRIAVAHNRNDQAETVLWNLVRGSGLKGLGGINPVRGQVIRPLLFTGRDEIERILRDAGISWRTDRTNLKQEFTRNKIRLSILPQMERELNDHAVEHIAQAARHLQQVQDYLDLATNKAANSCICMEEEDVCIRLSLWQKEEELIRRELVKMAIARCNGLKDVGSVHVDGVMQIADMDCGKKISLPGHLTVQRECDILRFSKEKKREDDCCKLSVDVTKPGVYEIENWKITVEAFERKDAVFEEIIEEKKYTKCFSYDTIKSNVLLRTRQTGDYLVVNSQGGKKKLKDYLIDCKVPRQKRDRIWLFADGSHVLWAVGLRISEGAKVTNETKTVLKIQLEEKET